MPVTRLLSVLLATGSPGFTRRPEGVYHYMLGRAYGKILHVPIDALRELCEY